MKWILALTFFAGALTTVHGESLWNLNTPSHAAGNLLETTKQARERHSAERYEYQQRYIERTGGYSTAPLGGYTEPLGAPAPYGTLTPGYVQTETDY